ncbi:hypothetical protein F1559_002751 [Cyanidiococcus yangmingshanensis]|uniref:Uncharacterized protein n=1 Tax=Cyanidiococcus yangmingshanensis TaxID=2690220 RepID=A0A7J7IN59_9RHOD|nr:hypothetical protein F1559_002751 [Cyanidiococcus yangmingshanensis]
MEDTDAAWMNRLRRDRGFIRTLGACFRALVMVLEDTDDIVFAEAFCALLRLCRGRSGGTEPIPSPIGLHCFEILDDSGAALIARFHRIADQELKGAILKEMPALVALSLQRHDRMRAQSGAGTEHQTGNRKPAKRKPYGRSFEVDKEAPEQWALSFLREFCIPVLRSERNLVRLQDEADVPNGVTETARPLEMSGKRRQGTERNELIWRAVVAFLLELASMTRTASAQQVLRAAIPALQLALTQRELSSGIGAYLFRRLLVVAMQLLTSTEDQLMFLSQQLELWPRLPRSCQTRANLLLLVSLTMEAAYQLPRSRDLSATDLFVPASTAVDVSVVCRSLFPPLRRNLLDSHLVREADWNRLRDTLFCAMVTVYAKLHTSLREPPMPPQPQVNSDVSNDASKEVLLRTRCHELTVSLQFISNFREYVFRYHGLSARYGDLMAALVCLVLEAIFFAREISPSLQQVAIGFIAETLRDCATHVMSPTALKIFSRGICRALPLLPPFDAENELYEMLVGFLERAIPRATALPAQRRSWRSSTGILRFEAPSLLQQTENARVDASAGAPVLGEKAGEAEQSLLGALLENDLGSQFVSPKLDSRMLRSGSNAGAQNRSEALRNIPDLLVDSDADANVEEANRVEERVVPMRKLVSEAAPILYESWSATEYAEFVRRSNLELLGSLFEMQKRFPGANSRALRTHVQLAVMQIALLAESPSRAFRDDVFFDVAATTDSQLRFLRIGEYATPESRDALLRRVASKDDAQLGAFTILHGGKTRPLVAAHVTDAMVETVRALLLHEHLLVDSASPLQQPTQPSNLMPLDALWKERQPALAALMARFLNFIWPALSADRSLPLLSEMVELSDANGPLQIRASHELDRNAGILWLTLDVQYREGICGFADILVGFEDDGESSASDEHEIESVAENPRFPTDSGWLMLPDQYESRFFLRQSGQLRIPLPLRRGVYFVQPVRVRVWWRACHADSAMFSSESAADAKDSAQTSDDSAAMADAAARVWDCASPVQLPLLNYPIEPIWLLLFWPLTNDVVSLDFCHGLWDRCPARRGAAIAPADAVLPAVAHSYLWVRHLLEFLERTFFFVTVAKAPAAEPRHAVLYARSRVHGHAVVIRVNAPLEAETDATNSLGEMSATRKPWILLHMRSEDALFLDVFYGHLERTLQQWNIPLDFRTHDERPLAN